MEVLQEIRSVFVHYPYNSECLFMQSILCCQLYGKLTLKWASLLIISSSKASSRKVLNFSMQCNNLYTWFLFLCLWVVAWQCYCSFQNERLQTLWRTLVSPWCINTLLPVTVGPSFDNSCPGAQDKKSWVFLQTPQGWALMIDKQAASTVSPPALSRPSPFPSPTAMTSAAATNLGPGPSLATLGPRGTWSSGCVGMCLTPGWLPSVQAPCAQLPGICVHACVHASSPIRLHSRS